MSEFYRKEAAKLIEASTSHEGQLDLEELASRSNAWAKDRFDRDPHRGFYGKQGLAREGQDRILNKLTIATREVLGLIPEKEWTGRFADNDAFTASLNYIKNTFNPEKYDLRICVNKGNMTLEEALNPSISMRSQGVTSSSKNCTR
jgi:hypothetical protein